MITRSETEVAVIAQFTAKEGMTEELRAALHHAVGLGLTNEPGCRRLILYQCVEDPKVMTVIEKFADQAALVGRIEKTDGCPNYINLVQPTIGRSDTGDLLRYPNNPCTRLEVRTRLG